MKLGGRREERKCWRMGGKKDKRSEAKKGSKKALAMMNDLG